MPSHAPRHAAAAPRFYISKTAIYYFYIIYMQVRGVAWHGLMPHAAPPVSFKIYSLEVTTINSDKHCFGGSHICGWGGAKAVVGVKCLIIILYFQFLVVK